MTWLTGQAHSFTQMAWTRALMGLSEACYLPAALALIADFHPGPTRSRAIGIHMCGVYAGQALGGIGGYVAETNSWRNAFFWFGAVGILYAVLLLCLLEDGRAENDATKAKPESVDVSNMVGIAAGAGITVAMGKMRDRGIGLGFAFTICAATTLLAGVLILLVRPRGSSSPAMDA